MLFLGDGWGLFRAFYLPEAPLKTADHNPARNPLLRRAGDQASLMLSVSVLLGFWIALYVPRVWTFGFDADDWVLLVHFEGHSLPDRLQHLLPITATRPLMLLFLLFYPDVISGSPIVAQAISAGLSLAVAGLMFSVLRRTSQNPSPAGRSTAALAGSIAWLVSPWSLAYTAWPILAEGLGATILFLGSWAIIAFMNRYSTWPTLLAALALTGSYLAYESFYGQFAFIALYCLLSSPGLSREDALKVAGILGVTQVLAIAVNRVLNVIVPNSSKALQIDLAGAATTFVGLPSRLVRFVAETAGTTPTTVTVPLTVLTAVSVLGILRSNNRGRPLMLMALTVAAIGVCILVYATAGYGLSLERRASRAFLGVGVFLPVLFFLLVDTALRTPLVARLTVVVVVCAFLGLMTIGTMHQNDLWRASWNDILTTIDQAPLSSLATLEVNTGVLFDGPTSEGNFAFLGNDELTGALLWRYPQTAKRVTVEPGSSDGWYLRDRQLRPMPMFTESQGVGYIWDGETLHFEMPGHWLQRASMPRMKLWHFADKSLSNLEPCQAYYPKQSTPSAAILAAVKERCSAGYRAGSG